MTETVRKKTHPLSFSQKNIWDLERAYGGTSINNISTTLWIQGRVDFTLLQKTLNLLLEKDPSLRTRITLENGEPVWSAAPYVRENFPIFDFSGAGEKGLKVKICSLKHSQSSDVINDIVEAKYVAFGSPTLNSGILPTMSAFVSYMKGLAFKNKTAFCFGSYGWKKGVMSEVEDVVKGLGWEVPEPCVSINYRPTAEALAELKSAAERVIK